MSEVPPKTEPEQNVDQGELIHYASIGSVTAEWAWLEQWVDFKTLELGKFPGDTGLCLTAQIAGIGRKLDAYIALARHLGAKKTLPKLNAFAKTATALGERRNRVVHDPWVVDAEAQTAGRLEVTARRTLRFFIVPVQTADVAKLGVEIKQHTTSFDQIHLAVLAELAEPRT